MERRDVVLRPGREEDFDLSGRKSSSTRLGL